MEALNNGDFPCDRCGECCRNLWMFGEDYRWLLGADGMMCRYFEPDTNLCAIYPVRPLICNIKIGHAVLFNEMPFSVFLDRNLEGCVFLKELKQLRQKA